MKHCLLALLFIMLLSGWANAQNKPESNRQFMQITTIESIVGGGVGRSKIIITSPDGSQDEMDLENLFSLTGINFKNIKSNELKITQTIKGYSDRGWKLEQVIPLSVSPGEHSTGIFMTRYLLSKGE